MPLTIELKGQNSSTNYTSLPENTAFNFSVALSSSSNSVALKEKSILLKTAEVKSKKNSKIKK